MNGGGDTLSPAIFNIMLHFISMHFPRNTSRNVQMLLPVHRETLVHILQQNHNNWRFFDPHYSVALATSEKC